MRTRRKIAIWPPPYDRISSRSCGRTDVNPRRVLTSTGKKHRTAAITTFELFVNPPLNHWLVIGANAMIGIAFAATKYGIRAVPSGRQRARTSATTIAAPEPSRNPPKASWNVYQPAWRSSCLSVQNADAIAVGFGSRNCWTSSHTITPCQSPTIPTRMITAGNQSTSRRPTRLPRPPRGIGWTATGALLLMPLLGRS